MILVTGGTGLLGAQLLFDLTSAGRNVRAMRRRSSNMAVVNRIFSGNEELLSKIDWVEADLTDVYSLVEAMNGVKEIYHCAVLFSFDPADYSMTMKVNVEGTANMVNMALENGVEKFCHVSSVSAIGRFDENEIITETSTWKPSEQDSNYAISKYKAEQEVSRGMEEGLKAVIVIPSIILGPGDLNTSGSTELFAGVWKGLKFYSEGINGFVDVRDVTKCMLELMESEIYGERFIISSENISYRDLFNEIADAFGKPRPHIKVNSWLSKFVWRMEAFRSFFTRRMPFIRKETAQSFQNEWFYSNEKMFYSNEKIRKETGIKFIPVKQSVRDTCKILLQTPYFMS